MPGKTVVVIGSEDHRGKQLREHQRQLELKKSTAALHDVSLYKDAAASGEHAVEVDLFKIYDTDSSGELSAREIRQMLGLVRTAWEKSSLSTNGVSMPGAKEMMAILDSSGDGEVSLSEWVENMPESFQQGMRKLGPDLLHAANGDPKTKKKAGHGKFDSHDHRAKEKREHKAKMEHKKKSRGTASVAMHTDAHRKGERAIEIDLFTMFDADGSGTLSKRELRQMLGLVRTAMAKGDKRHPPMRVPGMEEMLGTLDSNGADAGDGEVSLEEWTQNMPEEFRRGVRALGPSVLKVAQNTKAKSASQGGIKMSDADHRGKDLQNFKTLLAEKDMLKNHYAVEVYAEAARNGEHAVEIDLFKAYDVDRSGVLSSKELRQLLNLVRKHLGNQIPIPGMQEMLDNLDKDGDGEVSLDEWCSMPTEFRDGLRSLGSAVLKLAQGVKAPPKINHSGKFNAHDHRAAQRKKDAANKEAMDKVSHMYEVKAYADAARRGEKAVEIDLFKMYDVDHSGSLSARELRQALGKVRALDQQGTIPKMDEMLDMLDQDGDGEVTLQEWLECIPADFKAGLRKVGHEALMISEASGGSTSVRIKHSGKMATANHRGQEHAEWEEKRKINQQLHRRATKASLLSDVMKGNSLDTESLFKQFDTDLSGKLSLRELRQALATLDLKGAGTSIKELLALMDADGNGEVDIHEFEEAMPPEVRGKLMAMQANQRLIHGHKKEDRRSAVSQRKVDKSARPKHSDEVACPWRTQAWRTIREEEEAERLTGKGTFAFGQRVPYHGNIRVPRPPPDPRRAAVLAFQLQLPSPTTPPQVSVASMASSHWSAMSRQTLLQKRSIVSKHIDEAHNGMLRPRSQTARGPHAAMLAAMLSPRASPYALPHALPALGRPDLRQVRHVTGGSPRSQKRSPRHVKVGPLLTSR